ncbi:NADH oxidase [Xylaria sp. FL0933]|nr:NADH oxidase [Xylaria sp. FL0933]
MSQRIVPRWPSTSTDVRRLAEPIVFPFSKRTAPNRFLKAATSERLASFDEVNLQARGVPSPELVHLYAVFGRGGWGQILTGNIQISYTDLEAPGNPIIPPGAEFSGPRFDAFAALAAAGKSHGSLIVGQVSHPGRQVPEALQPHPISASPVHLVTEGNGPFGVPRAATQQDIDSIIEGFAHAAEYLERAGFDGMELHGAHGYLIAQFLSATTNQRTDKYGGSLENRMRFVLEIAAAIKKRISEKFILGIKVNSVEFQAKGFTPEEAVVLCQALENAGFDYVETSGGTYENMAFEHKKESTVARENYFVEFAERIRKAVSRIKVYTTGGLKTVGGMLSTLEGVDGLGIGRAAIQEPSLAGDILSGKITGAMKSSIPETNFVGELVSALYTLEKLGRGEAAPDLTDPKVVEEILSSPIKAF